MNRRIFIKSLFAAVLAGNLPDALTFASTSKYSTEDTFDAQLKDYLYKMRNFDKPHQDDVYLKGRDRQLLSSVVNRLKRVQYIVGYGNFHLVSFDQMLQLAKNYSKIGDFSQAEVNFLDMLFHRDAAEYGFIDVKPFPNLTDCINTKYIEKVEGTGHYLYRGKPSQTYKKIKQDLGDKVILTSGIRSVVKQYLLFLDKTLRSKGNLSLASRSLAPPGYSFHSVGDFDVGQVNFGIANFTERFTATPVYKDLVERGYANLRYEKNNLLGVRFEPWHIKLNRRALG